MFKKFQHIHFVGIGGIGMSGIAEVLLNLGYEVSGSDKVLSAITERLTRLGAKVFEGHSAANVKNTHVVVTSTAVQRENPEVKAALRQKIPVISRAEMLAELMRLKYGITITGAHGKTTTTSMIASVLEGAALDPTVVVGGVINTLRSNAKPGQGDFMVVEADESDKSFLKLSPTLAVVTNIDLEHLEHYKDLADIRNCFEQFMNKVPFYGCIVMSAEDEHLREIAPRVKRRIVTYGRIEGADVSASEIELDSIRFGSSFVASYRGERLGTVTLNVPGEHNVLNALAAIAIGLELEIEFPVIAEALADFHGVERRFQMKGSVKNDLGEILVVDDYGHHPTEIRATLAAAKNCGRRLVVLFQPHRYTRTAALEKEFIQSFGDADCLLLCDIYPASEKPIAGVTSLRLAEEIQKSGHQSVLYIGGVDAGGKSLEAITQPGDLVITLGAGNVYQAGEQFLENAA